MMRKLAFARAALNHPSVKLALAGMAITWAVQALIDTVAQLREDVAGLTVELRTAQLAAARVHTSQAAVDGFHARTHDLDPLGPPNPADADDDTQALLDDMADR